MKLRNIIFIFIVLFSISSSAQFKELFTHPSASKQVTAKGRSLDVLHIFNGKIFMGYGDYDANIGPIDVYSYAPKTKKVKLQYVMGTEAVGVFKNINGNLYVPSIDPAHRGVSHDYAYKNKSGKWVSGVGVKASHIYDTFTYTGSDLWMVGSKGSKAMAWRSYDNGVSWSVEKSVDAVSLGQDSSRFYFAGQLNGKLYLQPVDFHSQQQRASLIYDGRGWSNGPRLFNSPAEEGSKFLNFKNKLVYRGNPGSYSSELYSFDGNIVSAAAITVDRLQSYDYVIYKNAIYVLAVDGYIYKSKDFMAWKRVGNLKHPNARSMVIHKGVVYVGTLGSKLFAAKL